MWVVWILIIGLDFVVFFFALLLVVRLDKPKSRVYFNITTLLSFVLAEI